MKQRSRYQVLAATLFTALLVMGLLACGGGGGGGGGNGGDDGGNGGGGTSSDTTTLSEENVSRNLALLADTVPGCSFGSSAARAVSRTSVRQALGFVYVQTRSAADAARTAARTAAQETVEEIPGSCGGAIVLDMTADDTTGALTGSVDFQDYCEEVGPGDQVQADGSLTFSGSIDPQTGATQLTASSSGVSVTTDGESFTVALANASVNIDASGSTSLSADSLLVTDNATNEQFGVEDFTLNTAEPDENTTVVEADGTLITPDETLELEGLTLTTTENPTTLETSLTLDGGVGDSQGGSLIMSTTVPFVITDTGELLPGGTLEIDGEEQTGMTVSSTGAGVFEVSADTDGDGVFDFTPDADLECSGIDLNDPLGLGGMLL